MTPMAMAAFMSEMGAGRLMECPAVVIHCTPNSSNMVLKNM